MNLEAANIIAAIYGAPPFEYYDTTDDEDPDYGRVDDQGIPWLTQHWLALDPDRQLYVLLHEIAHSITGQSHDLDFYAVLAVMISEIGRDILTTELCREMEQVYPEGFPYEDGDDDEVPDEQC